MSSHAITTLGFDFLEFTSPCFSTLNQQFHAMGFMPFAKHKNADVTLYQQNNIRFLINMTPHSIARQFANDHGPSVCAMGFKVEDAKDAFNRAISLGARPYEPTAQEKVYDMPAIYGVGDSLIYFVDYQAHSANYLKQFDKLSDYKENFSVGLTYIDHVTHNLRRGQMDKWADFYSRLFDFHEVRYFDIEGQMTGLKSRAMASPCGNIRIPLNESADDKSQIEEFIKEFNGEGIQHIALGTNHIYNSVEQLKTQGLEFLKTPLTYYELIDKRLPNHGEDIEKLIKNNILIDGQTISSRKLLLQIFTKTMLGPVFFEIIQRKGDEGFGEGNFRALFESIELDQIRRGVLMIEKDNI